MHHTKQERPESEPEWVRMRMRSRLSMRMEMCVHCLVVCMAMRMELFSPTLGQCREPTTDQYHANRTLKREPKRCGDLHVEAEHHQASQEQGHGVTDAPRQANSH